MNNIVFGVLCLFGVVAATGAAANDIRKMSLDELVAQSDLVVIARGSDAPGPFYAEDLPGLSEVVVFETLKGSSPAEISVVTKPFVVEQAMRCCSDGEFYILFLRESSSGRWVGTNGPYSSVRIALPTPSSSIQ